MRHTSRKKFLQQTTSILGAALAAPLFSGANSNTMKSTDNFPIRKKITALKNVRLETGFERDDFEIIKTKTGLFSISIENGKIKSIDANNNASGAIDAKGLLLLPAMKDMHIHLDKTYYGGEWKARSKRQRSVKDMIALEEKIMRELLKDSTRKAEKIIELLQSHGTNFARSHVNIEPTSQLDSLKNLQTAIENKSNVFGVETVAFPQHGVYYKKSDDLLEEATKMGVDFIGGVDPYSIDGAIEPTIDFTIQLALDYKKGIDIHLHETGESGLKTVEYLIKKVNENPELKGKTFLSHCFVLGRLDEKQLEPIAAELSNAKIGIISTVPIGKLTMPLPVLYKHGVVVMTGTDSVIDHWQPFGLGNMLEKANQLAQLYGYSSELELSRALRIATADVLPLDNDGKQQWPKPGDETSFNLVDASCSAEAVARIAPVKKLIHRGLVVFEKDC